jgi:hypothetical protein
MDTALSSRLLCPTIPALQPIFLPRQKVAGRRRISRGQKKGDKTMTDYQVFDIRTEPETDAGIYEASSEQEAINAAVKEFAGNDNSPEVDDLRAERL